MQKLCSPSFIQGVFRYNRCSSGSIANMICLSVPHHWVFSSSNSKLICFDFYLQLLAMHCTLVTHLVHMRFIWNKHANFYKCSYKLLFRIKEKTLKQNSIRLKNNNNGLAWHGIDTIHSKWISVDLLWCWYKWGEYILFCIMYTYYNFRFLSVSSRTLLFFINSITFQFVWRDVDDDDFFFCFFFSISNFKIKIRILHMFHRLENTATNVKPQPAAAASVTAAAARGFCRCYKSFKELTL